MIIRNSTIFFVAISLIACGGNSTSKSAPGASQSELSSCLASGPSTFIDHTRLTQAQITAEWKLAQQHVGVDGVFVNALDNPPTNFIVDGRALSQQPSCTVVDSQPDVSAADLIKLTGDPRWKDPTNTILLGSQPVHSYVTVTSTPEDIVSADSGLEINLTYEMENILLHRLGYSTARR